MKIDRLIGILMLMINRKKVTAKELADHFNVSVRTIQRDIDSLTLAGVPLYADVGKNGGYQLLEHYKVDKSFLNINESKVLIAFLESLQKTSPNEEVKSIYNKFQTVLPEAALENKVVIRLNPLINNKNMQALLKKIAEAQDGKLTLEIEYINAEYSRSFRKVHPYTMVMFGSAWYLYGFCELRQSFRLFKLTRIANCKILKESFLEQVLPDNLPWDDKPSENRKTSHVVLEIDRALEGKLPDYFSYEQCEIIEDKIRVNLNFPVDEWFYSLIMGMMPHVKILEPRWVKDEVVKRIEKSLALNKL